jgi:phosphatidylserine/phosphatidylglycerophosphate/cardiolipin synthase-like enzyme
MDQFGSIQALAAAIRIIRADRGRRDCEGSHAELIMTGPAIEGDPNRDTRVVVREVFESARRSVLIVGYAFFGSDKIFEPLARRMGENPALTVRIVVNIHPREGDSTDQAVRRYAADFLRTSWPFHPRPEIYYLPGSLEARGGQRASVHAKLIVADEATIYLGSANFTTAAFERNIEAGIHLNSASLGFRLINYFSQMIDKGILSSLPID